MVSDFISANYGWLQWHNPHPGQNSHAHVLFCAGKGPGKDGWFTNLNIIAQLEEAMNILTEDHPNKTHVFVLDNTTIHAK